ncbi:MAG TPA: hypothetical protein VMV12_02195 [Candidatus Micrarchaeaceae archaeon]|nr:hypothetical protein [Candidatus Micrarchaeaceae archaeon]
MPQPCTVCRHPRQQAVDAALVKGESDRATALKFQLGARAVGRHRENHLSPALAAVTARREEARHGSLADRAAAMLDKAEGLIDRLEREGATGMQLAAMREFRGQVETVARLTGAIDESTKVTVNLLSSSEVQGLVGLLLSALAPFPEARIAAAGALSTIDAGAGS